MGHDIGRNTAIVAALIVSLAAFAAAPEAAFARSEIGFRGWGPRVGITVDPDQAHFGFHLDFGRFSRRVHFQPNFELGIGDDVTVTAVNFEAAYRFLGNPDSWSPYAGGGIGVNFIDWDDERERGRDRDDDSDIEAGLNLLAGIEKGLSGGDRFFTEVKLGATNEPDLKLTVGWTFAN